VVAVNEVDVAVMETSRSAHGAISSGVPLADRFSRTYAAHFLDLYRFLRRLGVLPRDLEDVCHEVFLVFHRKMADVLPGVTDRAFLFGIGARAAADYRRLRRHDVRLDGTGVEEKRDVADPEAIYAMRQELSHALDRLTDDKRSVFVMHDLEGMSAPEMAAILGVPVNTVYSRLRLARADFECAVAEIGGPNA
jgi:RNA polymerase sigma-70 factor (ECF subfamily)